MPQTSGSGRWSSLPQEQWFRGEYGARAGKSRILTLLKQYDIKATFCVLGWTADTYPHLVKALYADGHEIGHHGYEYECVVDKGRALDLVEELQRGIESLQRLTGEIPQGYRSPAGHTGPYTFDLFVDHGFVCDSRLVGDDQPYWLPATQCMVCDVPRSSTGVANAASLHDMTLCVRRLEVMSSMLR